MSLLAVLFVAVGCVEEKFAQLDELQVSQSIIGFNGENPEAVEVIFKATSDWAIASADGKELPTWFTAEPLQGTAGETTVVFKAAGPDKVSHEADLVVNIFDAEKNIVAVQHLMVKQGVQSKEIVPLNKIANEGVVGATYYVHATIVKVKNSKYGNLLLKDESGTLDVYGTLNKNGEEGKFGDLGLEVGDEIWAHGPFSPYNGTPQLKNITVDKFKKSYLKVDRNSVKVNSDGLEEYTEEGSDVVKTRDLAIAVTIKGDNVSCVLPEWISIKAINPGEKGATIYVFNVQPFEKIGEKREGEIIFKSAKGKDESVVAVKVEQIGLPPALQEVTIDKFLAAQVSDMLEYKISGVITEIQKAEYGNIMLKDGKGEILVYGLTSTKVEKNDKSFGSLGLKVGDWVTIIGKRGEHNGNPQMVGAYYESSVKVAPATFAEFLAKDEADHSQRSLLKGKVKKIDIDKKTNQQSEYGNLTLVEEGTNAEIYVYGLVDAPSYYEKDGKIKFSNNKSFPNLGIKEGDVIQICSFLGSYNTKKQAVESYVLPVQNQKK